jgi:hypothetical protein
MVHGRTDKHSDITIAENPDRLIVIVLDGKTGFEPPTRCRVPFPCMSAFANAHLMPQVKITSSTAIRESSNRGEDHSTAIS